MIGSRWRRRLLVAAVVVVAGGMAAMVGWVYVAVERHGDFPARFIASRTALDAFAARVMAAPVGRPPALPATLGSFEPTGLERGPDGFLFFCDYGNPLDANGLAYLTRPPPATRPAAAGRVDLFEPLGGHWYAVLRD